ncbi:hypothetical protein [Methylobacterium haplocladii]|uniref:hypothetical protein n=1 Tax=Methylobacterium haplocladii TaxID=1176176 RepID=UPI001FCEF9A1|nr:hypothetical protein [Methylobacterium haplocladii]
MSEAMDDTHQLREQLSRAWQTTLDAAIAQGMPTLAVIETMSAVAHARFADSFGPAAAANYLQLLAEQLRDIEQNETGNLISGEQPQDFVSEGDMEMALDPNWLVGDKSFE